MKFDKFHGRIVEGKKIEINDKYIENAFITLYEIGFKLGQTIFRKIFSDKKSLEVADFYLNETGYNHLKIERWDLAKIIFEYAYNLNNNWISSDRFKKIFLINLCIAIKKLDAIDKVIDLLDTVDWTSTSSEFKLAVSVLKDDYIKSEKIMSSMDGQEPITENDFREWPLFIDFRKTDNFARAFKQIFEKEYDGMPSDIDLKL